MWWKDFTDIVGELLTKADGPIVELSTSGIGLPTPRVCRCAPAILYGVDTRAHEEVEELTERYGEDRLMEVCGNL